MTAAPFFLWFEALLPDGLYAVAEVIEVFIFCFFAINASI